MSHMEAALAESGWSVIPRKEVVRQTAVNNIFFMEGINACIKVEWVGPALKIHRYEWELTSSGAKLYNEIASEVSTMARVIMLLLLDFKFDSQSLWIHSNYWISFILENS